MRIVALIVVVALLPVLAIATRAAEAPKAGAKPAAKSGGKATAAATKSPTFAKDVAPILFDNCVSCHRQGEVAPFTLTSYEDARKRAKTIARVTEEKFMPPWKAVPGHGDFVGARLLTD